MNRRWIAGVLVVGTQLAFAAPMRPADPALELAHDLPAYRASMQGGAAGLPAAIAQARSLIDEGRRRADIRAFAYADKILAPFTAQASRETALALVLADIHQYRHDFEGAAKILDQVLARDNREPSARLMRAQIRLTQGRGLDALRDCLSLVGRESAWVWSACSAQAYAISGRLPDAKRLLEASLRGSRIGGPRGSWVADIMAQLSSQAGDTAGAETWLQKAVAADSDDHVAAIELIDLWNATGRAAKSIEFMRDRPASDAYLIRRAQALRGIDETRCAAVIAELQRRFSEADALGDRTHLRERADFELSFGNARAALAHARENFRSQRELVDLRILLQAAVAAHDKEGAQEGLQWLRASHAQDQRFAAALRSLGAAT